MKIYETNRVFGECLNELENCHRQVLELRFMQQLSNEKIAERLHLPVNTVRTRLCDARSRLYECLAHRL